MSLIIPNTFANTANATELQKLDENFQYLLNLIGGLNSPPYWSRTTASMTLNSAQQMMVASCYTTIATALVAGNSYTIYAQNNTDFTLIGAANNNVGTVFTATGPGLGVGVCINAYPAITITLPPTPSPLNFVVIADGCDFNFAPITVNPGSNTIERVAGPITLSTTSTTYFIYDGTTWQRFSTGISVYNDITTNSNTYYPMMTTSSSGALSNTYVANTKLFFNPYSGTLSSTQFDALSDISLKTNIATIPDALDKLNHINGVNWNWLDSDVRSAGLIAQEVETQMPELVFVNEDTGYKTLNYNGVIGLLVQAVKELSEEVKELKRCQQPQD